MRPLRRNSLALDSICDHFELNLQKENDMRLGIATDHAGLGLKNDWCAQESRCLRRGNP